MFHILIFFLIPWNTQGVEIYSKVGAEFEGIKCTYLKLVRKTKLCPIVAIFNDKFPLDMLIGNSFLFLHKMLFTNMA